MAGRLGKLLILAGCAIASAGAYGALGRFVLIEDQAWQCRNEELEVSCGASGCAASEAHTPKHVAALANGELSVCAYSGCWSGEGLHFRAGTHYVWSARDLEWTGTDAGVGAFILAIDAAKRIGVLLGEGFASPMRCARAAPAHDPDLSSR